MNFYLCLASLCLGIAAAAPQLDATLDAQWEQWKSQHRRTYGGSEDNWRRATWEKNLRMIEMHNLEYSTAKRSFHMEMNKFGDMTIEEFSQVMTGFRQNRFQRKTEGSLFREPLFEHIPESVDWRKEGSLWFLLGINTTGSLEGQWFRKTGKFVSLSEQNLIDCSRHEGNHGCAGGFQYSAFDYVKKNGGIDTEKSYPYEGKDGICRYDPKTAIANITGYVELPRGHEGSLREAVAFVGPISVGIDALHESFRFYESGVYYEPECYSNRQNHAVLVVGYGVAESGEKYWIVKNSWGEGWGENGYILMARDKDNHCGIALNALYPEV